MGLDGLSKWCAMQTRLLLSTRPRQSLNCWGSQRPTPSIRSIPSAAASKHKSTPSTDALFWFPVFLLLAFLLLSFFLVRFSTIIWSSGFQCYCSLANLGDASRVSGRSSSASTPPCHASWPAVKNVISSRAVQLPELSAT